MITFYAVVIKWHLSYWVAFLCSNCKKKKKSCSARCILMMQIWHIELLCLGSLVDYNQHHDKAEIRLRVT